MKQAITEGRRFKTLTLVSIHERTEEGNVWKCICDCGEEKLVLSKNLYGTGCQKCAINGRKPKHGLYKTRGYRAWLGMKRRCNNPNTPFYKHYGGRGIKICERWNDPVLFIQDMGQPGAGMELDRIDNDGPYSPENCRWITHREQMHNTRRNVMMTARGKTQNITQWAKEFGLCKTTVWYRKKAGATDEEALFARRYPRNQNRKEG